MKLATFHHRGHKSIGEVVEEHTIDLPAADPKIPPTMLELLWPVGAIGRATEVVGTNGPTYPLDTVRLLAAVPKLSNELSQAYRGGRASQVNPTLKYRLSNKSMYRWTV